MGSDTCFIWSAGSGFRVICHHDSKWTLKADIMTELAMLFQSASEEQQKTWMYFTNFLGKKDQLYESCSGIEKNVTLCLNMTQKVGLFKTISRGSANWFCMSWPGWNQPFQGSTEVLATS